MSILPSQASVNFKNNLYAGKQTINLIPGNNNTAPAIHAVAEPGINSLSIDNFNADFENVKNVKWQKNEYYDAVSFSKNGKEMTAYYNYNKDGELIGTTMRKNFKDLPLEGQRQIKDEYSGYTIGPIILFRNDNVNPTESMIFGPRYSYYDNYFVEMAKGNKRIVVQVNPVGMIYYFRSLGSTFG